MLGEYNGSFHINSKLFAILDTTIYIFIRHTPDYCGIGAHQHQGKIEEKRSKLQKVKPPTPTRAIDALIGKKQKGKGREATGSFGRLLRPTLIIQWTYSEPCQHGDIYIINVCVCMGAVIK